MNESNYILPNNSDILPDDIYPGANLSGADLSGAWLYDIDLSEANLRGADLPNAVLDHVDMSGANLVEVDLSGAFLGHANLSEANLSGANLSNTNLTGANLSEANLSGANLSDAVFAGTDTSEASLVRALERYDSSIERSSESNSIKAFLNSATLTGATVSRETEVDAPGYRIKQKIRGKSMDTVSKSEQYDVIARVNRELLTVYGENGLFGRARTARVRERRARRKEARADDSWQGTADWVVSLLSRVFTGYGVRLTPVVGWIVMLWLLSAGVYWYWGGMAVDRSLYYSVVTLTTAPPQTPPPGLPSFVAAVETIVGTLGIVLLGYVIASRERI